MKEATLTLTPEGDVVIEFGGDLEGVCCGKEDKELREALKSFGMDARLKAIHCKLPQSLQRNVQNGKDDGGMLQESPEDTSGAERPKIVCNLFYPLQIIAFPAQHTSTPKTENNNHVTIVSAGERR